MVRAQATVFEELAYERTIPDCQGVIVPGAGHFVNVEQPERFNDLLLKFLARLGDRFVQ